MPPILGNLIAIAAVALLVFFSVRSLWRSRKTGGCAGCSSCGSCGGSCAGCAHNCPSASKNASGESRK